MNSVHLVECPRDAMQGIHDWIPTELKTEYLNLLLQAGFGTLDFGSFVSPKAIPQMKDTAQVLEGLNLGQSKTQLLAIVANLRGAEEAADYDEISCLGYPFSVSETFQVRNTNSTMAESWKRVEEIREVCARNGKTLVVYLSMGFGNPYGDQWSPEIVYETVKKLNGMDIGVMALSDTVGVSNKENISALFTHLIPSFPDVEFGAHLHSHPSTWKEKVEAAWNSGCRRFDSALKGIGGCPMADDKLVGNLATENLVWFFGQQHQETGLNAAIFKQSLEKANEIFGRFF